MTLSVVFYPYHFVRTILSMPFCLITFCPYTILSIPFCPYHFVRYHFVLEPNNALMPGAVTGQNGSGQNGTDKMVWTKWYTDKMVWDKMVWTKCYGQNGVGQNGMDKWYGQNDMDKMVWTKWYGPNGSNFWIKIDHNSSEFNSYLITKSHK